MTTLPNMGLDLPTPGADRGTWDDKINACFALVDPHDHTSGKGVAITVAALNIDTDLPMGGHGLTGAGYVDFVPVEESLVPGVNTLFVYDDDGELYYRTTGGVNVQLTSGTSINATLLGGITGDYAVVGAEVAYSDADQVYTFKDQEAPTKKWARVACGPVRIYDFDTTESVYVEHAVDAALAAPYTVTWPAAVPASNAAMQINASGVVTFATRVPFTKGVSPCGYGYFNSTAGFSMDQSGDWNLTTSSTDRLLIPVNLNDGDVITGFAVNIDKNSNGSNTLTATLKKRQVSGATTDIAADTEVGNATGVTTLAPAPFSETYDTAYKYWIEIKQSAGAPSAADQISWTTITGTRSAV